MNTAGHVGEAEMSKPSKRERRLKALVRKYRRLVRHCWVHSGYVDCGYNHMDEEQRALYRRTIGRQEDE